MSGSSRKNSRQPRLGRGLSSLVGQSVRVQPPPPAETPQDRDSDDSATQVDAAAHGASQVDHGRAESSPIEGIHDPAAETSTSSESGHEYSPPASSSEANTIPGTASEGSHPTDGELRPDELVFIDTDRIRPNPHQPRQGFDGETLQALADSIRNEGIMQPILVRPAPTPGQAGGSTEVADEPPAYELIAGERRWRAARLVGLARIPAIIRQLDARQAAEWALIENLQREDLNPVERAEAFRKLCDQYDLSHEEVAARLGVNRSTVANTIRLLDLAEPVLNMVRSGDLTAGHARALLGLTDPAAQSRLASKAVSQAWSVRRVEEAVRQLASSGAGTDGDVADPLAEVPGSSAAAGPTARQGESAHLDDISRQLSEQLGTRVTVTKGKRKGSGRVIIEFYSLDEFDALTERLGVRLE